MSKRRVVVTGIGIVSPIGNDRPSFWNGIVEARSGAGPITLFDATQFKTHFAAEVKDFKPEARIDRRQLRTLERVSQFACAAAKEAVEDAGLAIGADESPRRFGVITGSGIGGLQEIEDNCQVMLERGPGRISPYMIPKMMVNAASGNIAIAHGFQGPNLATVSACASSQHALGMALDLVARSICDVVLAGGTEAAVTRLGIGGFNALKALSTRNDSPQTASRPFTKSRDGFVLGEGAAIFVFESEERARARGARVYCQVLGFGMTDDASHITAPLPSGAMAAAAMRGAIEDAGVNAADIEYVSAHGTSTPLNDVMETRAIREVFGAHADRLMVSSTKSQVGHLLGASGAVELAAVALGLHHEIVPPTINYDEPDPECDLDYVPNQPRERRIRLALSNSFGFGGHNACLCVGRYEA